MSEWRGWSIVAVILAGCDGDPATGPDAADRVPQCVAVRDDWAAFAATVGRDCVDAGDCVVVGSPMECEGRFPAIGDCLGTAFNGAAYAARGAEVAALEERWDACAGLDCALAGSEDLGCAADCGAGYAMCDDGVCTVYQTDQCSGGR